MRNTLLLMTFLLITSCGTRKVNKQKIKEAAKIEVSEVKKENVKETELSEKEVKITVVELETSKLEYITLNYKGKAGDQIEIIKETGKLILKGSGEISIKAQKGETNKREIREKIVTEDIKKDKETTLDNKANSKQTVEKTTLDKQIKKKDYTGFYIAGFLLLIIGIVYLLRRFKVF